MANKHLDHLKNHQLLKSDPVKTSGSIPLLPLYAFKAWTEKSVPFTVPCQEVSCHLIEGTHIFPGGSRLQHHLLDLASEFIPLWPMSAVCENEAVGNRVFLGNSTLQTALTPLILKSFIGL